MSAPAVIRIFFAIDLPEAIKEKIGQFMSEMRKKAKSNGIRWSRPENLHITLQFLPEVKAEHLQNLIANVRAELEGMIESASYRFGRLELLPSPFRPRVMVLGIDHQEDLELISRLIGHGIQNSNYPIETRPFNAHLTLGRLKHRNTNLEFMSECTPPNFETFHVDEVVLFRSDPQPEGSTYTLLEKIHLSSGHMSFKPVSSS